MTLFAPGYLSGELLGAGLALIIADLRKNR